MSQNHEPGQNGTWAFHRGRRVLLLAIGVIALLVWSTWCGLIVSMNPAAASTTPGTSAMSMTVVSTAHGYLTPP